MASSMVVSNLITNNTDGTRESSNRKKKKKMHRQFSSDRNPAAQNSNNNEIRSWNSECRHEVYSSKLLQALRQIRLRSGDGRAVRDAADRALAMTAKGGSRWSRAILRNKLKRKLRKSNLRQRRVIVTARLKKPRVGILRLKSKNLPAVQRKARDLGRLVPGCRKQPLPVVLEEATDYIAALEMQVKAMAALADLFSGSAFGAGAVNLSQLGISQPPPTS